MLGKIPRYAIPIAIVVLVIGLSVAMRHFIIQPKEAELASQQSKYNDLNGKAQKLETAKKDLEQVTRQWKEAQAKIQRYEETRSIPLSTYMPIEAMITLAYEYRHDLGPVLTKWLEHTGCQIVSTINLPSPPGTPPSPSGGFLQEGSSLSVTVSGTIDQIRALYESLNACPRVITIAGLDLRPGTGDQMTCSFTLNVYLLVEGPAGAAAPAGGGGGGTGMPGMPSTMGGGGTGMPGMPPGMTPGKASAPSGGTKAAAPSKSSSDEESGGGGLKGGLGKHGADMGDE